MKIEGIPYTSIDWSKIPAEKHSGVTGEASWKVCNMGNFRVRLVEYSPGYEADHWCSKGHIIQVLEGEIHTKLKDGRVMTTKAGGTIVVSDDIDPHCSHTETGVKLLIID